MLTSSHSLLPLSIQPSEGKHWIHETKHDGYRCQVLLEQGEARVFTRNGHDWTDRFPSIVRAAANLRCQSAIIDGEAIVQDGNGASDFEVLSSALRRRPHSIVLYAFDLLHLDGKDLRQETLLERRASLKHLVGADDQSRIQFSDEFDGDGDALFKACAEQGLEGIVSKHALAPYRSGRLGSRPSALPNQPWWWSARIGTARPERLGHCLLTRTVRA